MARIFNLDVVSGMLVLVIGAFTHASIGSAEIGSIREMGPGYLPRILSWAIIASGALLLVRGLIRGAGAMPDMHARPLLLISLSAAVFGAAIDRLGMVLAVVLATAIATLASPITRHRETPLLCAGLALAAVLVFVKGLGLAIPIWPR